MNVGCSLAAVMLLSSKANPRGHPGLIHSAPLALMSTRNVSAVRAAYQEKPNVVLCKQIVFSDYVSLSFVSSGYNFGLTDYG